MPVFSTSLAWIRTMVNWIGTSISLCKKSINPFERCASRARHNDRAVGPLLLCNEIRTSANIYQLISNKLQPI